MKAVQRLNADGRERTNHSQRTLKI